MVSEDIEFGLTGPGKSARPSSSLVRCEPINECSRTYPLEIMATYFVYIDHYRVFTDYPLGEQFGRVARLASTAPRQLHTAFALEEGIGNVKAFNRVTWTIWGGQYGGAERGGLEQEVNYWPTSGEESACGADIGGWEIYNGMIVSPASSDKMLRNLVTDNRPVPLHPDQGGSITSPTLLTASAIPHIQPLIVPTDLSAVKMLGHIPYARRLITAVLPTNAAAAGPTFKRLFCGLVTVPAAWSDAEGWRRQTLPLAHSDSTEVDESVDNGPLERETATLPDPDELILWIEPDVLHGQRGISDEVVGMALRGRWGHFGDELGRDSWWAFKAKDCRSFKPTACLLSQLTSRCPTVHVARYQSSRGFRWANDHE